MNANVTVYLTEEGFKILRDKLMDTNPERGEQLVSFCFLERGAYYIEVSVDIKCVQSGIGVSGYLEV